MLKKRDEALDIFRGLTIALMIVVNNPGSWSSIYKPLKHAAWHGLTPTDLVFPFFLFIVGCSIFYSLQNQLANSKTLIKILRRVLLLFGLGLFLNAWPLGLALGADTGFDFAGKMAKLRILGVLQRIALCYGVVAIFYPYFRKLSWASGLLLLVVVCYELIMRTGASGWALEANNAARFDIFILGDAHSYHYGKTAFEPEGFVSTLTAIATTLLGLISIQISQKSRTSALLFSCWVLLAGLLMMLFEPVNKPLWTFTYVLLTAGLALLCYLLILKLAEVKVWLPFKAMGLNAIVIFAGASLLAKTIYLYKLPYKQKLTSTKAILYQEWFLPFFEPLNASLAHSLAHLVLWLVVAALLYHRRIFIKV